MYCFQLALFYHSGRQHPHGRVTSGLVLLLAGSEPLTADVPASCTASSEYCFIVQQRIVLEVASPNGDV
jgi:hypothetical protein